MVSEAPPSAPPGYGGTSEGNVGDHPAESDCPPEGFETEEGESDNRQNRRPEDETEEAPPIGVPVDKTE